MHIASGSKEIIQNAVIWKSEKSDRMGYKSLGGIYEEE